VNTPKKRGPLCNTIANAHSNMTIEKLNPCSISVVCLTSVYISFWKEKRIRELWVAVNVSEPNVSDVVSLPPH
jgi:hypothetical protein